MRAFCLALFLLLPNAGAAADDAVPKSPEALQARALIKSGGAHEDAGQLDAAAKDYAGALATAEHSGDLEVVGEAEAAIGYLQYTRGDMDDALVSFRKAYDLSVELGQEKGQTALLGYIAMVYADAKVGEYDKAIEYYQLQLARQTSPDTLFNIASTYETKGDLTQALDWYQRALAAEDDAGHQGEAAYVKRSIGMTLGKLGRPAEALPLLNAAVAGSQAAGDADRAMMARQSRGVVYRQLGRAPEAIADLEATRRWFDENKNTRFLEKSEAELALAYAAAGRWHEAYDARTRHAALQAMLAEKLREEHSARLRVQFDTARTEQENRALTREQASAKRIQKLQDMVLILGGLVIVTLLFLGLRLKRDAQRMRVMALTDELTRLPNRRHLLTDADELLDHSYAAHEPLTVIAFDIDHFKRINDQHGHAAGDVVLRRVAHVCRMTLRPNDRIGRTGGEEFICVLPATDQAAAVQVAERMRAAVAAMAFPELDAAMRVTISLGVAERGKTDTLAGLIAHADTRLYQAKNSGRNQVVPAPGA